MNRNLLKAIEKVLDDADLAKKFLELESIEDMYEFLQKFENNFTVEELEYTIEEISKAVTSSYMKLEDESLFEVAGGNKMTDVMKRITGTGMAALTLMGPLTSFTSHAAPQNALETTITGEKVPKSHSIVKKFKDTIVNWTKENPGKAVGGSVLIAVLFTVAVNKIKNSSTPKEAIQILFEWWSEVKETINLNEFKNMVKRVKEELSRKYEERHHDTKFEDKWNTISKDRGLKTVLESDDLNFDRNKERCFNAFKETVEVFANQYLDEETKGEVAGRISAYGTRITMSEIRMRKMESAKKAVDMGGGFMGDVDTMYSPSNQSMDVTVSLEGFSKINLQINDSAKSNALKIGDEFIITSTGQSFDYTNDSFGTQMAAIAGTSVVLGYKDKSVVRIRCDRKEFERNVRNGFMKLRIADKSEVLNVKSSYAANQGLLDLKQKLINYLKVQGCYKPALVEELKKLFKELRPVHKLNGEALASVLNLGSLISLNTRVSLYNPSEFVKLLVNRGDFKNVDDSNLPKLMRYMELYYIQHCKNEKEELQRKKQAIVQQINFGVPADNLVTALGYYRGILQVAESDIDSKEFKRLKGELESNGISIGDYEEKLKVLLNRVIELANRPVDGIRYYADKELGTDKSVFTTLGFNNGDYGNNEVAIVINVVRIREQLRHWLLQYLLIMVRIHDKAV